VHCSDLSTNQLQGTIPSSIGNFTALQLLYDVFCLARVCIGAQADIVMVFRNLGANKLVGTIPSSIGLMASVFLLCLDNNQLSGSVPTSLGNLTKLETMYVLDNDTEQRGVCVFV
jgi:Leucine-rich repeat (LRR) protein